MTDYERYKSIEEFNKRYVTDAPMPDMHDAAVLLATLMENAEFTVKAIRRECVEAVRYENDMQEKLKDERFAEGHRDEWFEAQGEAALAHRLMETLGYRLDHWFCGTPIFKAKEES